MQWKHKVSLDWLTERQNYLSASEVKSLIPFTKTGRPRKVTDVDYLKIYANKLRELTEEDCWSYNEMARGHLLEPYAIEAFNRLGIAKLYHWDDRIVTSKGPGFLGFSPDALDVPMDEPRAITKATVMGEVKCYNPATHLITAQMDIKDLDERWQIATAMAVAPNIQKGYLILYNPDIVVKLSQLYAIEVSREDLEDEIEMILEVEDKWNKFTLSDPLATPPDRLRGGSPLSSSKIMQEIESRQRLNP